MGDRANVFVTSDHPTKPGCGVFIYTHWGGDHLAEDVLTALAKEWRWGDSAYLTRIIYDTVVGEEAGKETGYGISPGICDNEHPIVVVDTCHQEVGLMTEETAHSFEWCARPLTVPILECFYRISFQDAIGDQREAFLTAYEHA